MGALRGALLVVGCLVLAGPAQASTLTFDSGSYTLTGTDADETLTISQVTVGIEPSVVFEDSTGAPTLGPGAPVDCKPTSATTVQCTTLPEALTLDGGAGDDVLTPGLGAETLDGGAGTDVIDVSLEGRTEGVVIDLQHEDESGPDDGDVIERVEGATGTEFSDQVYGTGRAGTFRLGEGNDFLDSNNRRPATRDDIECGAGTDRAYTDRVDVVRIDDCEKAGYIGMKKEAGFITADYPVTVKGSFLRINGAGLCVAGGKPCTLFAEMAGVVKPNPELEITVPPGKKRKLKFPVTPKQIAQLRKLGKGASRFEIALAKRKHSAASTRFENVTVTVPD